METISDQFGDEISVDIEVSEQVDGVYLLAGPVHDYVFSVKETRQLADALMRAAAKLMWEDDHE